MTIEYMRELDDLRHEGLGSENRQRAAFLRREVKKSVRQYVNSSFAEKIVDSYRTMMLPPPVRIPSY